MSHGTRNKSGGDILVGMMCDVVSNGKGIGSGFCWPGTALCSLCRFSSLLSASISVLGVNFDLTNFTNLGSAEYVRERAYSTAHPDTTLEPNTPKASTRTDTEFLPTEMSDPETVNDSRSRSQSRRRRRQNQRVKAQSQAQASHGAQAQSMAGIQEQEEPQRQQTQLKNPHINEVTEMQPFERIKPPSQSMNGPVTYARAMRGEIPMRGKPPSQPLNTMQGIDTQPGKRDIMEQDGLKLRLELNLDIEIELKASIHGDLTLALL